MEKLKLILAILLISAGAFAQNVGINADGSAPDASAILDVSSTTSGFLAPRMTAAQRAAISSPATGLMVYQTDAPAGYYYYNGSVWTLIGNASDSTQWTTSGSDIYYSSGNVGVGAISPGHKLTVQDVGTSNTAAFGIDITGDATFTWASSAIAPGLTAGHNLISLIGQDESEYNAGYIGFNFLENGSSSNFLTFGLHTHDNLLNLTGAGNVGIGTTTPASKIHVFRESSGDGHSVIEAEYGSDGGRWTKAWLNRKDSWDNWYGLYISSDAVDPILVAKQDGNVGIGTTNPGSKLQVAGFGYGVAGGITMTPVNDTEGGHYITFHNTVGTAIGSIARGAGNTVAYNTSSDYRLKENVVNISASEAITRLMALRPVEYNYISDQNKTVISGFLAHEMADAGFANGVTGEKDAVDKDGKPIYQAIDTKFIIPEMVKVIQEQQAQINELKQTVAELSKLLETALNK